MNILYVENHAVFAETVRRQFLSHHSVTVAPSLFAAREALLNGSPFDLFLVDYDLDDGKGDEFVQMLRASDRTAIIIGVSAHEGGNAALLKAGATTVCGKMNFDEIAKTIGSIMDARDTKQSRTGNK